MTRIADVFTRARAEHRKALITYICAGDPTLDATARLLPRLAEAGADIIELGVPFSDPIADGPAIEAAAHRALRAGASLAKILDLIGRARKGGLTAPIVLMGYVNPFVAMGVDTFCERAQRAGVDGLIVPDLPLEEAGPFAAATAAADIDLVRLAAPTSSPERLAQIGRLARGFLYYVSVTGVTGERADLPDSLAAELRAARAASQVPVAVGFGISTPAQARALAASADAIVVGSALVRAFADARGDPEPVCTLVTALAAALREPVGTDQSS